MGSNAVNTVRVHTAGTPTMKEVDEEKEGVGGGSAGFTVLFGRLACWSFLVVFCRFSFLGWSSVASCDAATKREIVQKGVRVGHCELLR